MRNNEQEPQTFGVDSDRVRAAIIADLVIERLGERFGISADEVVESLRWVREHREFVTQLKRGGLKSIVSLLLTAAAIAIWEGVKSLVHK